MDRASFPEMYERELVGPLFRPWAELTLKQAGLSAGDRVLDIACGTGIVARLAAQQLGGSGLVVGVDISPDMLAVARSIAPEIDWREGNASALPLREGEQFDLVVCHQGLQFFPDKQAAAAEMHRAVAAGGRVVVSIWRSDDEVPVFSELRRIAERRLGPIADHRYGYGDPGPLEGLLRYAGFTHVRSKRIALEISFEESASFLRLNTMALVGMSAAGKAMDEQERKQVVEAIMSDSQAVADAHSKGAGLVFEAATNFATARAGQS
jgi:ubiquinone/menaquinone biosynthesis C-methylase UbiE